MTLVRFRFKKIHTLGDMLHFPEGGEDAGIFTGFKRAGVVGVGTRRKADADREAIGGQSAVGL